MVLVDCRVMVLVMECKKKSLRCWPGVVTVTRSRNGEVSEYHEAEGNEDAYAVPVRVLVK